MSDNGSATHDERRSKVGRLVTEYGLDDLPGELEARWTAPREE